MALFGKKKKTEEKSTASGSGGSASGGEAKAPSTPVTNHARVFSSPRITEKATMHEQSGVYTFDVALDANKREIIEAVRKIFKVTPRKIRIVPIPAKLKRSMRTGKRGVKKGGKKAYVYLKKGDTINIR